MHGTVNFAIGATTDELQVRARKAHTVIDARAHSRLLLHFFGFWITFDIASRSVFGTFAIGATTDELQVRARHVHIVIDAVWWPDSIGIQKCLLQSVSCFDFSQSNCLKKHTLNPEITLLHQFYAKKAVFKGPKICNINFWIENAPHPPLALFRKFIRFGCRTLPQS